MFTVACSGLACCRHDWALYHVTPEAAPSCAEEVCCSVPSLNLSDGRRVTISINIASTSSARVTSIEALVGESDTALYRAKTAGRDQVWS